MIYTVTLRLDITDETTLTNYVRAFVPGEFCLRLEDIEYLTAREALVWLYDPGTSFPGTTITDCQITAESAAAQHPEIPFTLPGFIPWH
jgi:hypothetical protein